MMDVLSYALSKKYTNEQINEQKLKVAKLEQELNNYKSVMSQVNINQEATQKATGYGIVSLPPNAAEGQISVVVKGNTRTNLAKSSNMDKDSNGDGVADDFSKVLHANHTGSFSINNGQIIQITNSTGVGRSYVMQTITGIKPNTSYCISVEAILENVVGTFEGVLYIDWYQDNTFISLQRQSIKVSGRVYIISTSPANANRLNITLQARSEAAGDTGKITFRRLIVEEADKLNDYISSGTKSTLGAFRIRSVSEDESQESVVYVLAKDDEGNIEELRSLPNGVKDEINVTDRKLIKRIGEKSNIANGMVIDFADMAEGGTYYAWNKKGETETGTKGDTLGIDAITLIYQLATPLEIPIQVSGTLVSYPSGTVYVEPFVADAGLYNNGITVLHQDLPIKSIEKISKIDYETGLETILDASKAVIASDKLSFTHPDIKDGDIVFFTYEYDRESTEGETEIEYYDSRYVIKDSVTDKFYKWHIAVADGTPTIELVEV